MPDSKIELGQQLLQKFTAGSTSTRIQTMLDTHGRDQTAALLADKFCEKNPELCKTVPTSSDQNVTIQETFDESEPVGDQFRFGSLIPYDEKEGFSLLGTALNIPGHAGNRLMEGMHALKDIPETVNQLNTIGAGLVSNASELVNPAAPPFAMKSNEQVDQMASSFGNFITDPNAVGKHMQENPLDFFSPGQTVRGRGRYTCGVDRSTAPIIRTESCRTDPWRPCCTRWFVCHDGLANECAPGSVSIRQG